MTEPKALCEEQFFEADEAPPFEAPPEPTLDLEPLNVSACRLRALRSAPPCNEDHRTEPASIFVWGRPRGNGRALRRSTREVPQRSP